MSKPWDHLRTPLVTPFGCGSWHGQPDLPTVSLKWLGSGVCNISFGAQPECRYTAKGLRQLAEFCTELADQLESP